VVNGTVPSPPSPSPNDKIRSYLLATAIKITFLCNDEANIERNRTMSRPGMTVNSRMSHLSTRMIDDEGARLQDFKRTNRS